MSQQKIITIRSSIWKIKPIVLKYEFLVEIWILYDLMADRKWEND